MLDEPLYISFPPNFIPNEAQEIILDGIQKALLENKKFIIINAPTGTGKSFIAKTLANYSDSPSEGFVKAVNSYMIYDKDASLTDEDRKPFGAAILTVTKSLQDQYINMFPDGSFLKGKANYECTLNDGYTCESGACSYIPKQLKKCLKCDQCLYYKQRNEAATNICSFYSYAMFEQLPPEIKNKEFIICDEASELESEIVSRYTIEILTSDLAKIDVEFPPTPYCGAKNSEVFNWVSEMSRLCEYSFISYTNYIQKELKNNAKKKKINKEEYKKLVLIRRYREYFNTLIDTWGETEYIVNHTNKGLIFQPYNVDKLAYRIFDYGKIIILMSATIVNPKKFAETLGIDDYYFIEAASSFSAKRAPIKCATKFRLNYKNKTQLLPVMAKIAKNICELYPKKKGIIHTHSMEVLNYLKKELGNNSRYLFRGNGVDNEKLLSIHQNTKLPTVLISPSMTHGIDLKGKLGEFQVVMKAPYLPLSDSRIKRKAEEDEEWYTDAMLSTLVQMCGRCNRTEDDYSETYILDGLIVDAIARNKDKLPKYFIDRLL